MFRKKKDHSIIPINNNKIKKETNSLIKRSQALSKAEQPGSKKESRIYTGHTGSVNCCVFGDGFLLSGGEDSNIFSWDYNTGRLLRVFKGHQAAVTSIVVIPGQKNFVSSSEDGSVRYWRYSTGESFEIFNSENFHIYGWGITIEELAISQTGVVYICGRDPLPMYIWEQGQTQIYHLSGKLGGLFTKGDRSRQYMGLCGGSAVTISSDGEFLAAASERTIFIWDLKLEEVYYYFGGPPHKFLASPTTTFTENIDDPIYRTLRESADKALEEIGLRHAGAITSLAFLTRKKKLVSCSEDKSVRIWDFSSPKKLVKPPKIIRDHEGIVRSVAVSNDGKYIISGGDDKVIRVHNANTCALKDVFEGHESSILDIAVSKDGDYIASCSQDGTIRLWNSY